MGKLPSAKAAGKRSPWAAQKWKRGKEDQGLLRVESMPKPSRERVLANGIQYRTWVGSNGESGLNPGTKERVYREQLIEIVNLSGLLKRLGFEQPADSSGSARRIMHADAFRVQTNHALWAPFQRVALIDAVTAWRDAASSRQRRGPGRPRNPAWTAFVIALHSKPWDFTPQMIVHAAGALDIDGAFSSERESTELPVSNHVNPADSEAMEAAVDRIDKILKRGGRNLRRRSPHRERPAKPVRATCPWCEKRLIVGAEIEPIPQNHAPPNVGDAVRCDACAKYATISSLEKGEVVLSRAALDT
jgi:hypothetical protein